MAKKTKRGVSRDVALAPLTCTCTKCGQRATIYPYPVPRGTCVCACSTPAWFADFVRWESEQLQQRVGAAG